MSLTNAAPNHHLDVLMVDWDLDPIFFLAFNKPLKAGSLKKKFLMPGVIGAPKPVSWFGQMGTRASQDMTTCKQSIIVIIIIIITRP